MTYAQQSLAQINMKSMHLHLTDREWLVQSISARQHEHLGTRDLCLFMRVLSSSSHHKYE